MNFNRLTLSLAFGFAGLTAAHGQANVSFDKGVAVRPILESLRKTPSAVVAKPAAMTVMSDAPANAGVKLMADVVPNAYRTSWQQSRSSIFGGYNPVDLTPSDHVVLNFKSSFGSANTNGGSNYTLMTFVGASLASAAEAAASCGSDQQMLKLDNGNGVSASPSSLCLPKNFERQEILVQVVANVQIEDRIGTLPFAFKLTVTP